MKGLNKIWGYFSNENYDYHRLHCFRPIFCCKISWICSGNPAYSYKQQEWELKPNCVRFKFHIFFLFTSVFVFTRYWPLILICIWSGKFDAPKHSNINLRNIASSHSIKFSIRHHSYAPTFSIHESFYASFMIHLFRRHFLSIWLSLMTSAIHLASAKR